MSYSAYKIGNEAKSSFVMCFFRNECNTPRTLDQTGHQFTHSPRQSACGSNRIKARAEDRSESGQTCRVSATGSGEKKHRNQWAIDRGTMWQRAPAPWGPSDLSLSKALHQGNTLSPFTRVPVGHPHSSVWVSHWKQCHLEVTRRWPVNKEKAHKRQR